jgi:hypothetical protein
MVKVTNKSKVNELSLRMSFLSNLGVEVMSSLPWLVHFTRFPGQARVGPSVPTAQNTD